MALNLSTLVFDIELSGSMTTSRQVGSGDLGSVEGSWGGSSVVHYGKNRCKEVIVTTLLGMDLFLLFKI